MKSHSLIRDIFDVISSNFVSLIASVIIGLLVPKILGATDYGYYRMFVLYTTYTAFLHFGFVDGILLKDGDKDLQDINKFKYRTNSILFIFIQLIIAIIFIGLSVCFDNKIVCILLITVGIGTFLINTTTYYRYFSQVILRFKELSIRSTIQAILVIFVTLLMWYLNKIDVIYKSNYSVYIWLMICVYFVMFLVYIISYRDITFGKHDAFILGLNRIVKYCKVGIYLTIAYQVSNLIMIIDNQFVSIFFKASVYGKYSFSYSITNTAVTILSAVATVLLPHLERDTFNHMIHIYHKLISIMMLTVYFALLAYYPLCILINMILPDYVQSLSYLRIFLPELGITCSVTMITFNYYNALGESKFYFYMSLIILLLSALIDLVSYILFHNSILLAFGSFIAIFIWYIVSEFYLVKWYHVKWLKNFIYMTIMILSFFITTSIINNLFVGFILYLLIYIIISIILFKSIIRNIINIVYNKFV